MIQTTMPDPKPSETVALQSTETQGSVDAKSVKPSVSADKAVAKAPATKDQPVDPNAKTGRVIVVTSGKGGVGKTTTTANIGTGLAKLGYKVVLVDTDIGLRNLDILMGLENRIVYNIVDVVEGRCKMQQALVKDKRFPNLQLLAAAQTRDKSAVNEEQMRQVCDELKAQVDFVLLDCPAGIEQGFMNATSGASEAIVVCTPEMSAVRDADRIIGLLEAREEIKNHKLILNRLRPNLIRSNDMMDVDDVLDILNVKLLGVIPEDRDIIVSTNRGEPIVMVEESLAGQAYTNIARRVAGEDVPLLDLNQPLTLMEKVKQFFTGKRAG
ncbi:MAG: septum site-determining protein MinD [Vampirovibrionales bacterium]|nr:septum site-determining protein MinD [Vampirovibrionales bacterium]